jgi:multidrug efflux pump subunit AcrA (membrane-fusion protein)
LDVPSAQLKAVQNATLKSLTLDIQGEQVMFDQPELLKRVDLQSDTFVLIAHQKGRDVSLAEGMAVEANLPIGEKVAHKMVPVDAILKNDVGSFVYKVIPAGQGGMMVIPVGVEVLFRIENDVAVQSEQLMKEDKVVVEGGERLFPMTPVKAKGE